MKNELLKCNVCGKQCKSIGGLGSHMRTHKNEIAAQGTCPPPEQPGEGKAAPPLVRTYRSPRNRLLRVVVKPAYWGKQHTPAGDITVKFPGKTAEFIDGKLTTSDPEVIAALDKYKDPRYPIVSDDEIREMRKCL